MDTSVISLCRYSKISPRRDLVFHSSALFLSAIFYTYYFFDGLNKQGLYCDVALFGNAALSILKNIIWEPYINIFGRNIPLMINTYNAGTDIYAILPWVYFLGNKSIALHVHGYIWGIFSIIILYVICLNLYHSKIYSMLASLVFATSPSFITASRISAYTGTSTIFFALASLLLLLRWKNKERRILVLIMGLFMGIGLAARIQFLWFINTVLLCLILTKGMNRRFFNFKCLALFLLGIIAGAFSLILGNLKGNFLTLRFLMQYAIVSRVGISNTNYLKNLLERFKESIWLIDGNAFSSVQDLNRIGFYIFIVGVIFIIWEPIRSFIRNTQAKNSSIISPLNIFLGIILQSPFTPTMFNAHHIVVLLPFICMIVCVPYYLLENKILDIMQSEFGISHFARRSLQITGYLTVLSILLIFLFNNCRLLSYYNAHRNIHIAHELKWDIMSEVKNYLVAKKIRSIGIGDTGLMDQLLFLSGFGLSIEEIFPAQYKNLSLEDAEKELIKRIDSEKEGYYLFRPKDKSWIGFFDDFCNIVLKSGKKINVEREFASPEGMVVYVLYKVN